MMTKRRTRRINGVGIGIKGLPGERMQDLRIFPENESVQVWAEVNGSEVLQYLTPKQAVQFAWAFLCSAFVAWTRNQ